MIQSNELRIGNWIEKFTVLGDSLGFCKVEAKDFLAMSNHPEWQNPIPLAEEILLKCGFVKLDKYDYFFIHGGQLNFKVSGDLRLVAWHNLAIHDVQILYLHQLQNLYFALTGKELEVRL